MNDKSDITMDTNMDNKRSDKDDQQTNKSSSEADNQDNIQDNTNSVFDFSSFGQYYLDQLNQVNQVNKSLFNQANKSSQASNPFAENMKLWQESVDRFSNMMAPNSTQSVSTQESHQQDDTQESSGNPMADFTQMTQRFLMESLKRVGQDQSNEISQSVMLNLIDGWQHFTTGVTEESPTVLAEQQAKLWKQQFQLLTT